MKKKLSLTMAMILLVIHVFSFQVFAADPQPEGPVITGADLEAARTTGGAPAQCRSDYRACPGRVRNGYCEIEAASNGPICSPEVDNHEIEISP